MIHAQAWAPTARHGAEHRQLNSAFIYVLPFFSFFCNESAPHRKWNVRVLTNCWLPSIHQQLDSDFLLSCCCVSCGGTICMISLFVQLIKTSGETERHSCSSYEEMISRSLLLPPIFFCLCIWVFTPSNWQLACVKGEKENKHTKESEGKITRFCIAGPSALVCGDFFVFTFANVAFWIEHISQFLTWILLLLWEGLILLLF